jgi:hypothetical protein
MDKVMRRYKQEWSYGLIRFCQAKHLNIADTVNKFMLKNNLTGKDKDEVVNKNWQKFAAFVNAGILSGKLKGIPVSVSNGSQEQKQENRKKYAAVDPELKRFWEHIVNKGHRWTADWFIERFFACYGLEMVSKSDDDINVLRNRTRYEVIVKAGLLKEFYLFDDTLVSKFKPKRIKL